MNKFEQKKMKNLILNIFIILHFPLLAQAKIQISHKFLEKTEWSDKGKLYSYGNYLVFLKNEKFTEEFAGEGGCKFYGSYKIENSLLKLTLEPKQSCNSTIFPEKERICSIQDSDKDPFYRITLNCNEHHYYNQNFLIPPGELIEIDGIKSVLIKEKIVISESNLKIREKPDINSKNFQCTIEGNNLNYMPKGSQFRIFARTEEKVEINNKISYWYFAEPIIDWYSNCYDSDTPINRVWIFGAYVK
ncbi:hypothetical protein ND856_19170 [Leptospira bandrabouensis]|uniref:hypothetical protein n=1 Tax=Leptospira bandrabouensis TaxID=2484903 RepID=UPI00223CAE6D|nr:hypothetical protein [Leptospira bandrabouensis]MCW7460381.1 hypothetical protein [Leptospira bandrabouensis]MCW7479430.1 hypothetical protein [Leptospira bandrabouensis]MCW7487113.1 hypothetical protein [Leptospira bandrabouensis]